MRFLSAIAVLLIILSCSNTTSNTETAVGSSFIKEFGGAMSDGAEAVIINNDGYYMVAGYTASSGSGLNDAWLLKIDDLGNIVWDEVYGEAQNDVIRSLDKTTDGGFILGGWTMSYGVINSAQLLIKVNDTGIEQWANTFDNPLNGQIESVIQASDNSYIFAGYNEYTEIQYSSSVVSRADQTGFGTWAFILPGQSVHDLANDVIETSDHFLVSVGTKGVDSTSTDIFVSKIKLGAAISIDSLLFSNTFNYGSRDYAEAVLESSAGDYLITGTTDDGTNIDYYLLKIDKNGNEIWRRTYATGFFGDVFDLIETDDGGFLMTGFIFSSETITINGFLLKVNANGDEEWFRKYGDLGDAQFNSVVQAADGGYLAVGSIYYNNTEITDLYLVKTDSKGSVK